MYNVALHGPPACVCDKDGGLTCKALDLWVVCALSQEVHLPVQALQLLPQAMQLSAHIYRLVGLQHNYMLSLAGLTLHMLSCSSERT